MHPPDPSGAYDEVSAPDDTALLPPRSAPAADVPFDAGLLRRMAAGDESALGVLYDRWSPLLHSLALRIVRDADDAEEVVEETFWQAWRQAGRYESSRGAVSTWLTMMLRSRALDRVRAKRRAREERWDGITEPSDAETDAPSGAEPLQSASDGERSAAVRHAVTELPEEQRQVVEMAYFGGLSQSEIAEATGQPLGTVKTRARLALQKLRDALAPRLREHAP